MTKNIGIRVEENVSTKFEEIHVQLQSPTKGETFAKILEKYVLAEQTLVNTERLQQELTGANNELTEKNRLLTDANTKLADDNRLLTERNTELLNAQNANAENSQQIKMLTEQNEALTEQNKVLAENQNRHTVTPKWEAIAQAYAELNEMDIYTMLWFLFASYTKYNLYHDLKRPKDSEIKEIIKQFNN